MKKEKLIPLLLTVSRVVLGLVFIFSGFVKGVDPMGSMHKFSDYFNAFNMGFLDPLAIVLAFLLSGAEFLIGISLLFNFRFRLGAWAIAIFMGFFTVLTFILALTNPVSDCGCFGDALIMTNWQTFFKNLFLLPFVFIVFFFRKKQVESYVSGFCWSGLMVFGFLFLVLEFHAYNHLPQLDFRPYSTGTHIPDKMTVPDGAAEDVYRTILLYEKDGEVREFTEDNFPWEDTSWTFVDSEHTLLEKGYEPPIHDFTIVDEYGIDLTNDVLQDPGYSFLLVSTHLDNASRESLVQANEIASWSQANAHSFYCLTSSVEDEIIRAREDMDPVFGFHASDEVTLKTIIRSNPGLLLIKDGTILSKWHHKDFPSLEELEEGLLPFVLTQNRKIIEKRTIGIYMALFLVLSAYILSSTHGRIKLQ